MHTTLRKEERITTKPLLEEPAPVHTATMPPTTMPTPIGVGGNSRGSSIVGLVRELMGETRIFVRQEITLVKTEMSEKLSYLGRNAVALGAGVAVAYAGAIVLLIGFGFLIAWAIYHAGVQGLLATFLGLAGIGLVPVVAGGALILKGISAMKAESLAPQRTLQTLQELKAGPMDQQPKPVAMPPKPKPSSQEMQSQVEDTEAQIGETLEALRDRLNPRNINVRIKRRIQVHPYRNGLFAMGAGVLGGLAIRRRFHRA